MFDVLALEIERKRILYFICYKGVKPRFLGEKSPLKYRQFLNEFPNFYRFSGIDRILLEIA